MPLVGNIDGLYILTKEFGRTIYYSYVYCLYWIDNHDESHVQRLIK